MRRLLRMKALTLGGATGAALPERSRGSARPNELILHDHSMGLDLLPRQHSYSTKDELPRGMTHPARTPCPFDYDHFPISPRGTCCALRGKVAADNLGALGELDLVHAMHTDMTMREGNRFATRLRDTADRIEQRYAGQMDKLVELASGGTIDARTGKLIPWPRPSFEEAIASIREAADWYDKVAFLGFDVHAWL